MQDGIPFKECTVLVKLLALSVIRYMLGSVYECTVPGPPDMNAEYL